MKKTLFAGILALSMILAPLAATRDAHAIIGIVATATGDPAGVPLLIAGGATAAFGGGILTASALADPDSGTSLGEMISMAIGKGLGYFFGGAMAITGVVLLDSPSGPVLQYSALSSLSGGQLRLTQGQLDAFNENLDEINAIAQSVNAELLRDGQPTLEKSRAIWSSYSDELPPEALEAAAKVGAQLVSRR